MRKNMVHEKSIKKGYLLILFASLFLISIAIFLPIIIKANTNKAVISDFKNGSGTLEDPYVVSNIKEFKNITYHLDKHFIQSANLDFSEESFGAVGSITYPFKGSYDGQQYIIKGINSESNYNHNGLISFVFGGAVVKNVRIENSTFKGASSVGGIAGMNAGSIIGCYVDAEIEGNNSVGGVVGNNSGIVEQSVNIGTVIASDFYAGGISGQNFGVVKNSYNKGNIKATKYVGGISGVNNGRYDNGVIENTFNVGSVTGNIKGKIAGDNLQGNIKRGRWSDDSDAKNASSFNTGNIFDSMKRPSIEFKSKIAFSDFTDFDEYFMFLKNSTHPILRAEYVKVKSVEFKQGNKIKVIAGQSVQLQPYVLPSHATLKDINISLPQSAEAVYSNGTLTINEDARVGQTINVVASSDGTDGVLAVEVIKVPVQKVQVKSLNNQTTVGRGSSLKFETIVIPTNATIKEVRYTVSNSFADIDLNGNLTVSNNAPVGAEITVTAASYDNMNI